MTGEVGSLLSAFERFGANYCRNAKLMASDEVIKIIEIYETGLAGALSGITELVSQKYDALPDEQKKEVNRYVQLSGTRLMLEKVNQTIIETPFTDPDVLDSATELFQKSQTAIKDILELMGMAEERIERLLKWLTPIVESIRNNVQKEQCGPNSFFAPANRSGNKIINRAGMSRKAGEEFEMLATFLGQGSNKCHCCESRQYIRGSFTYNGQTIPHSLPSGLLDPIDFKEDGVVGHAYGPHFGHRNQRSASDDQYLPTRADGCEYKGCDFPGIVGVTGATFDINLEFRGEIIDVCNGNKVLLSKTWQVQFSGRL